MGADMLCYNSRLQYEPFSLCVSIISAVATDAVLPVQFRRRKADPSRRQRKIVQEKTSPRERDGGGGRDERETTNRRSAVVSHAQSRPRSQQDEERPNISSPDNAESE